MHTRLRSSAKKNRINAEEAQVKLNSSLEELKGKSLSDEHQEIDKRQNQKSTSRRKLSLEPIKDLQVERHKSLSMVTTPETKQPNIIKLSGSQEKSEELLLIDEKHENLQHESKKSKSKKKLLPNPTEDLHVGRDENFPDVRTPRTNQQNVKPSLSQKKLREQVLDEEQHESLLKDQKSKSKNKQKWDDDLSKVRNPSTKSQELPISVSQYGTNQKSKNCNKNKITSHLVVKTEDTQVDWLESPPKGPMSRTKDRIKERTKNKKQLKGVSLLDGNQFGDKKTKSKKHIKGKLTLQQEEPARQSEHELEPTEDIKVQRDEKLPKARKPIIKSRNDKDITLKQEKSKDISLLDEQQETKILKDQESFHKHSKIKTRISPLKEVNRELEYRQEDFSKECKFSPGHQEKPSDLCNIKNLTSPQKDMNAELSSNELVQNIKTEDISLESIQNIQTEVNTKAVQSLIDLMAMDKPKTILPALRSLRNILSVADESIDILIEVGGLATLAILLQHEKAKIVKESIRIITDITAGTYQQIQAVIDAGIFQHLKHILEKGDFKLQKAAIRAVTNTMLSGTPKQIIELIEKCEIMKHLINLMDTKDLKTTKVIQSVLIKLFSQADTLGGIERLCLMMDQMGGVDKLEALQMHEDIDVYKNALVIIDTYFNKEEEASKS